MLLKNDCFHEDFLYLQLNVPSLQFRISLKLDLITTSSTPTGAGWQLFQKRAVAESVSRCHTPQSNSCTSCLPEGASSRTDCHTGIKLSVATRPCSEKWCQGETRAAGRLRLVGGAVRAGAGPSIGPSAGLLSVPSHRLDTGE